MTMKSPDELNALKEELEALNKKLAELSEEELQQVAGGVVPSLSGPPLSPPSLNPLSPYRATLLERTPRFF